MSDTDFDASLYMFSTVWTGSEQITSVDCDRCERPVWERTGTDTSDSIDLAHFTALAVAHEREVHGR